MGNTLEIFVKRLKEEIENKLDIDHTLSIPKQANEMGISYQTFIKYVNGTASPNIANLSRMAKYYNVSTDYLIGVSNDKPIDVNISMIEKYTGLNQGTIDSLNYSFGTLHDLSVFRDDYEFLENYKFSFIPFVRNKKISDEDLEIIFNENKELLNILVDRIIDIEPLFYEYYLSAKKRFENFNDKEPSIIYDLEYERNMKIALFEIQENITRIVKDISSEYKINDSELKEFFLNDKSNNEG